MAKQVLTNVVVTFGTASTDISSYVASCTLNLTAVVLLLAGTPTNLVIRHRYALVSSITRFSFRWETSCSKGMDFTKSLDSNTMLRFARRHDVAQPDTVTLW